MKKRLLVLILSLNYSYFTLSMEIDDINYVPMSYCAEEMQNPICTSVIFYTSNSMLSDEKTSHYKNHEFDSEKKDAIELSEESTDDKVELKIVKTLKKISQDKKSQRKHYHIQCPKCKKYLAGGPYHLTKHLRIHKNEKPFVCKECRWSFSNKSNLTRHLKIHSDITYTCTTCQKTFSDKCNFDNHVGSHAGKSPFTCKQCGRVYTTKYVLEMHMLNHIEEKPFCCKKCDKTFTDKSNYSRHLKIHTKKGFICETCKRFFNRKDSLIRHMKMMHEKE